MNFRIPGTPRPQPHVDPNIASPRAEDPPAAATDEPSVRPGALHAHDHVGEADAHGGAHHAHGHHDHGSALAPARGANMRNLHLVAPNVAHPASNPAIPELGQARAMVESGRHNDAIALLQTVANDPARSTQEQAQAALLAADIAMQVDPDSTRAELLFIQARNLDPSTPGIELVDVKIMFAQGRTEAALTRVEQLLSADPNNVDLLGARAILLISNARRPDALPVIERALQQAQQQGVGGAQLAGLQAIYSRVLYENQRPQDAVAAARQVLSTPGATMDQLAYGHLMMSELATPPSFAPNATTMADRTDLSGADRTAVVQHFQDGQAAYQRGDYAAARAHAEEILRLAPDDGMAHRLWNTAHNMEMVAQRPLIEPLDTPAERQALVQRFEQLAAQGQTGNPPRPGTPSDLFPQWNQLNDIQKATVAYGILGYGDLIGHVITAGTQYNLVGVGESSAFFDPMSNPNDPPNAWGRHDYAGRGWWNPNNGVIVTGVERIDAAAHGSRSTITHEFAHLIHGVLSEARDRVNNGSTDAADLQMAQDLGHLEHLAQEARDGLNGQQLLDAYSGNNEFEWFAQAMAAYLNPDPGAHGDASTSRRLFERNPHGWQFARDFAQRHQSFPTTDANGAPYQHGTDHPAAGTSSLGRPLMLDELRQTGAPPAVRAQARATLDHFNALYNPGPAAQTPANLPALAGTTGLSRLPSGQLPSDPQARQMVEAARTGNFERARELLQSNLQRLERGELSGAAAEEMQQSFGEVLAAAQDQTEWKWWEILLAILTVGIAAGVIHAVESDARQAEEAALGAVGGRLEQAGVSYAVDGGVALANYRATHGDAALQQHLEGQLQSAYPNLPAAQVQSMAAQMMDGIRRADESGVAPPPSAHPELGGLSGAQVRERQAHLQSQVGNLQAINDGTQAVGHLEHPERDIGTMGFAELQGQVQAELAAIQELMTRQPPLSQSARDELTQVRTRLTQLGRELNDARAGFFGRTPRRPTGELPDTMRGLTGVPVPAQLPALDHAGLLQLHQVIDSHR